MSQIIINSDKTISINGKKTFVVQMHNICNGHYEANGYVTPCNPIIHSDFTGDGQPTHYSYMKPGHENFADWQNKFETAKVFFNLSSDQMYAITQTMIDSPFLFAYSGIDEPREIDLPAVTQHYKDVKARDPNHPVYINQWDNMSMWLPVTDILGCALYTMQRGGWVDWVEEDSIYSYEFQVWYQFFQQTQIESVTKPLFAVLQGNGIPEGNIPDGAYRYVPSQKELRANAYTAICIGFQGIGWWGYKTWASTDPSTLYPNGTCGLYTNSALFNYCRQIAREIRALNDILVLPTLDHSWNYKKGTKVTFSNQFTKEVIWDDFTNFSYMLKQQGTTMWLIVVNKDIRAITTNITIQGLSGSLPGITKGLETTGSSRAGRQFTVNNGTFSDTFDSQAVHIYQIGEISMTVNNWTISGDKGMTGTVSRNTSGELVWNITSPVQKTLIFGTSGLDIPGTYVDANGIDQIVAVLYEYNEAYLSINYSDTKWTLVPLSSVDIQDKGINITKRVCIGTCPPEPPTPPAQKWKCSGAPFYQCSEDPTGTFDSFSACNASCLIPGLSSILVTPGIATIIVGEHLIVVGTAIDSQGMTRGGIPIVWTSDPAGIVEIDPVNTATFIDGKISTKIKGISPGMCIIKGTSGSISGQLILDVNVAPPPPPTIKWKYSGAPDCVCIEDPTGTFNSQSECQIACKKIDSSTKDTEKVILAAIAALTFLR